MSQVYTFEYVALGVILVLAGALSYWFFRLIRRGEVVGLETHWGGLGGGTGGWRLSHGFIALAGAALAWVGFIVLATSLGAAARAISKNDQDAGDAAVDAASARPTVSTIAPDAATTNSSAGAPVTSPSSSIATLPSASVAAPTH